jgi:hypothetical protein
LPSGERTIDHCFDALDFFPTVHNPNASIGIRGSARITTAGSPTFYQWTSRQVQPALKACF